MRKNEVILLSIIFLGLVTSLFAQQTRYRKAIFLHRSVGYHIYSYGVTTNVPNEINNYNVAHNYTGANAVSMDEVSFPSSSNCFWDWWAQWSNSNSSFYTNYLNDTTYEVIVVKECFASQSDIWSYGVPADTGTHQQTILNYQWYCRKILHKMAQHTDKFFVWWNVPPMKESDITLEQAQRLYWFNKWMQDTLATGIDTSYGSVPNNVYFLDYYDLMRVGTLYQPDSLCESDSHPNVAASEYASPYFVQETFDAAINYEINGVTFQLSVPIENGWNLVSIPGLNPINQYIDTWWSNRVPSAHVFRYNGTFQSVSTVTPGTAYFMKHNGAQVYNTGDEWPASGITAVVHNPISGESGWNMIGAYENVVSTSGITTTPPGIQIGPVFAYSPNQGYYIADSLIPGFGYWIRLSGAGFINIPNSLNKTNPVSENFIKDDWGRIIITDINANSSTLFTVSRGEDLNYYELPPALVDMFDVRFSGGKFAEDLHDGFKSIEIKGVTYPITIRVENVNIILKDETGKTVNQNLKDGEELIIKNRVDILYVAGEYTSRDYSLEQNYPNPFNPVTTIRYSIPEAGNVKLVVYNILGQEIRTLVNEYKESGVYTVHFDASELNSGIYIYKLEVNGFNEARKMILIK